MEHARKYAYPHILAASKELDKACRALDPADLLRHSIEQHIAILAMLTLGLLDGPPPARGERDGPPPARGERDGPPPARGERDGPPPARGERDGPPPLIEAEDATPSGEATSGDLSVDGPVIIREGRTRAAALHNKYVRNIS